VTREVTRGVVTVLTARIKGIRDTGCLKFQFLLLKGAVSNEHIKEFGVLTFRRLTSTIVDVPHR